MRYAWDLQNQYLAEAGLKKGLKGLIARLILNRMRIWDMRTAPGVDHFIACSGYIARRVRKIYRRDAAVIYPNVAVEDFAIGGGPREDFYFTSSRMVPYKKMQLIVEAFARMPDRRLVVIGDGPQFKRMKAVATPNVTLLGYQPFKVLQSHLQRARAFIFAAEEDFGIAPVEAQASGTPVIAYGHGGATESIRGLEHARPTGVFFDEQSVPAIVAAIDTFERNAHRIAPAACRENALRFSAGRFVTEYSGFVQRAWNDFRGETARVAARAGEEVAAG
jgi:glycosyltransferase involved in cell wall biosynthesis